MMSSCVRASPSRPFLAALNSRSQQKTNLPCILSLGANKTLTRSLKLTAHAVIEGQYGPRVKRTRAGPSVKYRKNAPVCLLGGKDKSEGGKEGFPWSLDKVMENFKGKSVEDVLRQQIEKKEFYDGGSGNSPPRGGGGGDKGDGFGESEDEGLKGILEETLQVILATLGFIFLYVYIIFGEELTLLARDYLKYVMKGYQSVRLKKVMDQWIKFFRELNEPELEDKYWLEKAIVSTPTLYDSPEKYRKILTTVLDAAKEEEEQEQEQEEFGKEEEQEFGNDDAH